MIGIIGNEFFGKRIVENLNKKTDSVFLYPSLHDLNFKKKINKVKIIHFIGSPTISLHGVLTLSRFRRWGKKIIVHWIGGDAWQATNNNRFKFYTLLCKNKIDLHLADDSRLSLMIKKLNLNAKVQALPVAIHYNVEPLTSEKNFLVYLPDGSDYWWNRYNGNLLKKIVNEFPEINFIMLKNSGKYFDEPNVKCYKWIDDLKKFYKNSLALIRLPTHDGLPGTMIEMLSMGRHFVYSEDFPYCKKANSFEELKNVLRDLIANPSLNIDGSNYVRDEYNVDKITNSLMNFYENV